MLNIFVCMLFSLTLDYATFRQNDTLSTVELYIAMPYSSLEYYEYEGKERADYSIEITITGPQGDTVAHDEFGRVSFLTSMGEAEERRLTIIDQFSVPLSVGRHGISIRTWQQDSQEQVNAQLTVRSYSEERLSISELEMISEIKETETKTRFTKGNSNLIPNPERVYGENRNILYIYAELYGLSESGEYTLVYKLTDTMGNIVTEYPEKRKTAESASMSEISGINTVGLAPGNYIITLQLAQAGDTVYSSKVFYIVPEQKIASILEGKEEEYYSFIDYIASADELSRYKAADDKRAFLEVFWTRKGEDILLRYIEIARKADEFYGKKTDMGRIYITHGTPDEIVRFTEVPSYPDNVVWLYYGSGGKNFVFADVSRVGNFELVYSSYQREYTNPYFRRYLNPDVLDIIGFSEY